MNIFIIISNIKIKHLVGGNSDLRKHYQIVLRMFAKENYDGSTVNLLCLPSLEMRLMAALTSW
jgi:hypothetical protein